MSKKARYTAEQHKSCGSELKHICESLQTRLVSLSEHYPNNTKQIDEMCRAIDHIRAVRSVMEDAAFMEWTVRGGTEAEAPELNWYYGGKDLGDVVKVHEGGIE